MEEKLPSAYFYHNFHEWVLKWRIQPNISHADWVYSPIRALKHAVQTNKTILLLIYCMYTLINDSVAFSFAVSPSRAQKALEVGYSPFQLKKSVFSPLLNSSWSLLSSQLRPTPEPHSHEPKQVPQTSSSFFLAPFLSCWLTLGPSPSPKLASCPASGENFERSGVSCICHTLTGHDLGVRCLVLDGGKGGIGIWQD